MAAILWQREAKAKKLRKLKQMTKAKLLLKPILPNLMQISVMN